MSELTTEQVEEMLARAEAAYWSYLHDAAALWSNKSAVECYKSDVVLLAHEVLRLRDQVRAAEDMVPILVATEQQRGQLRESLRWALGHPAAIHIHDGSENYQKALKLLEEKP